LPRRAAGRDLAAAVLGVGDERLHRVDAARVRQRPHRNALLEAVAELEAFGVFGEARQEAVIDRLLHVEPGRRNADLAGIAVLVARDHLGRLFRIGVGEHDDGGMTAEFHGGALHALGRQLGEMLAHRDRAGERNLAHIVLGDQVLGNRRRHAEHQVEHAGRKPRIGEAAHHLDAGTGRLFRCLENERAAGGERAANLARRRQRREIPRREGGDDADRFLHHDLANALEGARHDTAIGAAALFGVPFDDIGRGAHLGARLGVGLAFLLHQNLADRIIALAHQVGGLAHDFGPLIGRGRAPHGKALLRGFERMIEIGGARMRQTRKRLLGRRIDHILAGAAVAVEPLAVDIEFELGVHGNLSGALCGALSRHARLAGARICGRGNWCTKPLAGFGAAFILGAGSGRRHKKAPARRPGRQTFFGMLRRAQ
jgi:ParB family chromosome partitioning protein